MAKTRKLTKGMQLDRKELFERSNEINDEMQETHELGEKFLEDQARIDALIDAAQKLPAEDSRDLLARLYAERAYLVQEYGHEVTEKTEELEKESQENIQEMEALEKQFEETESNIRNTGMDASTADVNNPADAAAEQKEGVRLEKNLSVQMLEMKMQLAREQQRKILKDKLRGR